MPEGGGSAESVLRNKLVTVVRTFVVTSSSFHQLLSLGRDRIQLSVDFSELDSSRLHFALTPLSC